MKFDSEGLWRHASNVAYDLNKAYQCLKAKKHSNKILQSYIEQIGHVHVADVPGRHEPGTGELNYHNVFRKLISLGYKGRIGFELFPVQTTEKAVKAIMSYQE